MTEREREEQDTIAEVRNFLSGYRMSLEMLDLRKYERKRVQSFEDAHEYEDALMGDETYWRVRMYEVNALLGKMKNGREKLILYYHYIRGLSIERAANLLGVSRRTGYRLHERGLCTAARLFAKL